MSRRASPTLRVLREDLCDGAESPLELRAIEAGDFSSIQPLNSLGHPILRKASDCFTEDPDAASFVGAIASVTSTQLLAIKSGQWRVGVWIDDDACWVVAAGLAKGGHRDRDDFYKTLERQEDNGSIGSLLPAYEDRELLKRERASAKVHEWQLGVQERLLDALVALATGGNAELVIPSASPRAEDDEPFATIELAARAPQDDYPSEDVTAELSVSDPWKGTQLRWHLTVQVLATICPPEEGWDAFGGIYSTLLEPGGLARRAQQVRELHVRGEIARSAPGTDAHYTHRRDLTERSVASRAVRALCGVYFVPRRDAESLDICPACHSMHSEIPAD